jgi:L-aspartate oxidase
VHGANRLASNSLLEGVVFGARAGAAMRECAGAPLLDADPPRELRFPCASVGDLRSLAWTACGVVRNGPEIERAIDTLEAIPHQSTTAPNRALFELRSIHTVLRLIARCALARRESRGAHYRADCPGPRPEFEKHSIISTKHDVTFE